ncbi:MAG TPA: phosphatase PAP2 family protein, partial [Bacteroidetes bacterium]|nr:phosphatase PAP2 family protein [Bacteroidota bacterium]
VPPDQYSFPSGHTAAAFLMAQLLGYQLPFLVLPLYILAGLIGYSRIYLRVHYPLDVFFGAVLGFVSANFALKLLF